MAIITPIILTNDFAGLVQCAMAFEVIQNGTYVDVGSGEVRPAYDLVAIKIVDQSRKEKERLENGVIRTLLGDGVLSKVREHMEFMDKHAQENVLSLTKQEQQLYRALTGHGLPTSYQLSWEREIHGPQSPTLENSTVKIQDTAQDGCTATIVAPTSGNLLVAVAGFYSNTGGGGNPSAISGWTTEESSTVAFGPTTNIIHKISNGAEGTSLVVTQNGVSQENGVHYMEWSGMEATSYTNGKNHTDSAGDVTARTCGSVTNTVDDVLFIAGWGMDSGNPSNPTGSAFSNSYVARGSGDGSALGRFSIRTASKAVSSQAATDCNHTWTNATEASGAQVAFKVITAVPPVNTVPVDTNGLFVNSDEPTIMASIGPATAISVVDAAGLTTCRVWCTSGDLTVTLSGSVIVSAGANGSSDLTLGSGASTAEFNTVLATLTYQGDTDFHGTDTINVVSTGTGGTDTDTFNVLNDPRSLTLTASVPNFAGLVLATASTEMRMDTGRQSASCQVTATDNAALTDVQTIILQVAPVETVFPFRNLAVPTARRDRR